jgi:hypothetical protein
LPGIGRVIFAVFAHLADRYSSVRIELLMPRAQSITAGASF